MTAPLHCDNDVVGGSNHRCLDLNNSAGQHFTEHPDLRTCCRATDGPRRRGPPTLLTPEMQSVREHMKSVVTSTNNVFLTLHVRTRSSELR